METSTGIFKIEFDSSVMPIFKESKKGGFVYYGEKNDYPAFLIDIYNKHPVHAAIIKAKNKFISGKGLYVDQEDYTTVLGAVRANEFLSYANRYEDWTSVYKKTVESLELFNGFAWQIIWNLGGTRCEVYCMQFAKIRLSEDGSCIYYSDNWLDEQGNPVSKPKYTEFNAFNPNNRKGTQVLYYKVTEQYATGIGDVYPLPEYKGAVMPIYTDIAISQFQNDLALNGFTAQGMLTFFKGEPVEDEKRKIERLFENKFVGPGNKKSKVMLNFTDKGDVGAEYTNFQVSDLDKQFEGISKKNLQDIITGHQIPNKGLVGISQEGALSDRTAIDLGYEQMQNSYVEPRQEIILVEINMIGELCGVDLSGVKVKKLKPIGVNMLDPALKDIVTKEEIRKHLGLEPLWAGPGQPAQSGPVNANLRALTGKDWIHINRVIREYDNGKKTREAAAFWLKSGYGLSDEDINVLLSKEGKNIAQFNEHKRIDEILQMYELCSQDDIDDPILYTFEKTSILESELLELIKGEPTLVEKPSKAAKMLNVDDTEVNAALSGLQAKGLLGPNLEITEKGIDTKTKTPDVEVYTVYKYVTRPDVQRAKQSRPFCKRLLELTASGKVWTKESIDGLTNSLGEDAWIYRGGFYLNPETGEVTPSCRHMWQAVVKTRRKK